MLSNRKIVPCKSCEYFRLQFNQPVRAGSGQTGHQEGNTMQSTAIGVAPTGQLERMMDGHQPQDDVRPETRPPPTVTRRGDLPVPPGRSERTPENLRTQFARPQANQSHPGPVAEAVTIDGAGVFRIEESSESQQYSYQPWIKPAVAVGVGVFGGLTAFLVWRKLTSQQHDTP